MKDYTNHILLKDMNDDKVDAIILSNEQTETIQSAIYTASDKYYDLAEDDNVPIGINCVYEYIVDYLYDHFDVHIIEHWSNNNVVYY